MINAATRIALDYFVSQGWTTAQAAGIVANLVAESGLNPAAVGDGGLAYGLPQWHPDRQEGFQNLFGKSIHGSSLDEQLAYVHHELNDTERAAGAALHACTTAYEAGACVSERYERPADRAGEAAKRGLLASSLWGSYTQNVATTAPQPDTQPAAPIEDRSTTLPTEQPMGALEALQFFGPILEKVLPQIGALLKPGSKAAAYAPIAESVVSAMTTAAGTDTLGGAIEKMQNDAAIKAAVQAAVVSHKDVLGLVEVAGGIQAAKEADAVATQAPNGFWHGPAFWISLLLMCAPFMLLADVFYVHPTSYQGDIRTQIVTGVLGIVLVVCGYWLGGSMGSTKKDELLAAK